MIRQFKFLVLFLFAAIYSNAREGMWIPILLDQNIEEMREMGFRLSIEDIYCDCVASMKDAIVQFGGGCTGELISSNGLLVTNYHCGYRQIQKHSSLENDYLTNGFWAMNLEEELPNPALTVSFIVHMEDVTESVMEGADTLENLQEIESIKNDNISKILYKVDVDSLQNKTIKPFFEGNQYFLIISETFKDVRLVGAPPSSIGKFGGDTDNWMWPRHTGDFSLFRIYAGKDNRPAEYSPENVPYKPRHFFPIDIGGISEGDFTMIFGFPGRTSEYLPSHALKMIIEQRNPERIAIRDIKLNILNEAMNSSSENRIKYAAKAASTSNAWKKWQGEIKGLRRLNAVEKKLEKEADFIKWVKADSIRMKKYRGILPAFDSLYPLLEKALHEYDYYTETWFRGVDAFSMYSIVSSILNSSEPLNSGEFEKEIKDHFKDITPDVDCNLFINMVKNYFENTSYDYLSKDLRNIFESKSLDKMLSNIYDRSVMIDTAFLFSIIRNNSVNRLENKIKHDNLYQLMKAVSDHYSAVVYPQYYEIQKAVDQNQQLYMTALFEMKKGERLYPDANFTLRVSYGKVEGYSPGDAVKYKYFTTLEGIIEKDNPDIYDYDVPEKLKQLYSDNEFGNYCNSDGTMPVCFTASNHTTGGNSGSPVIDADGNLVGINFDRCWEGTMSDLMFDPEKCRNIALDMRYMLFIIDKFAGAGYLLNEMTIID
ncbi:MAG: S46 family peptidase [Prolixibacteraceae bacterium]|nr:S46 family peptidase [Prolixibacteraceae bacterium]